MLKRIVEWARFEWECANDLSYTDGAEFIAMSIALVVPLLCAVLVLTVGTGA